MKHRKQRVPAYRTAPPEVRRAAARLAAPFNPVLSPETKKAALPAEDGEAARGQSCDDDPTPPLDLRRKKI